MKNVVVIFAGGSGTRMETNNIPKQFLNVFGKPLIIYTLEHFENHQEIDDIFIVCKEDWIDYLKDIIKKYNITKARDIVKGEASGQESIYNGLKLAKEHIKDNAIVLIHDGVRPILDEKTISKNIESVKEYGSAITCIPCFETVIVSRNKSNIDEALERSILYKAQAPQSFYLDDILSVHEKTNSYDGIVDSCTLMKRNGYDVHLINGLIGNMKITTKEDLYIFRSLITAKEDEQLK